MPCTSKFVSGRRGWAGAGGVCVCVCVCVRARARANVRACVCVRACLQEVSGHAHARTTQQAYVHIRSKRMCTYMITRYMITRSYTLNPRNGIP